MKYYRCFTTVEAEKAGHSRVMFGSSEAEHIRYFIEDDARSFRVFQYGDDGHVIGIWHGADFCNVALDADGRQLALPDPDTAAYLRDLAKIRRHMLSRWADYREGRIGVFSNEAGKEIESAFMHQMAERHNLYFATIVANVYAFDPCLVEAELAAERRE